MSDVWALGVILVNMITRENPWQMASLKDASFARFINNPDHLYEAFPMSKGAHEILRRVFTFNPFKRITLRELRKMIINVDTFFRPADVEQMIPAVPAADVDQDTKPCHWAFEEDEDVETASPHTEPKLVPANDLVDSLDMSALSISNDEEPIIPPTKPMLIPTNADVNPLDISPLTLADDEPYFRPSLSPANTSRTSLPSLCASSGSSSFSSTDEWDLEQGPECDSWSVTSSKDIEELDWMKGSTAPMRVSHYRTSNPLC